MPLEDQALLLQVRFQLTLSDDAELYLNGNWYSDMTQ